MENLLVTQIIVISFIFGVVALIALFNMFNINHHFKKVKKMSEKGPSLYDVKRRNNLWNYLKN